MLWFLRTSWQYLGCNHGTGRWHARRRYVAGIIPAALKYRALIRQP